MAEKYPIKKQDARENSFIVYFNLSFFHQQVELGLKEKNRRTVDAWSLQNMRCKKFSFLLYFSNRLKSVNTEERGLVSFEGF